jgi:ABC-type lipoprotein release transport system permease subunit
MSVALQWMFGRTMLAVPFTLVPQPAGAAAWLGLVLLVSLVATAWPAVRATRVPTAAALAYE